MAYYKHLLKYHGDVLGDKYKVEGFLGEGRFAFVTKCRHRKTHKVVAIKVDKRGSLAARQAMKELKNLRKLRGLDNIVVCEGFFFDHLLTCQIFELLDQNLSEFIKERYNHGLPTYELQPIVHQLASALTHLSSIRFVHGDIKPANIMVVNRSQKPLRVKLIDFDMGFSVLDDTPVYERTTWYSAPEVILHMRCNEAIDMWSLGLVVAELATGYPLYPGEMEYDVLNFIIETQGQPADHVLDRGRCTSFFFQCDRNSEQHWRLKTSEDFASQTGLHATDTRVTDFTCLEDLQKLMTGARWNEQRLLVDLIKQMLQLDADQRIKPLEVLRHPFLEPPPAYEVYQEPTCSPPAYDQMNNAQVTPDVHQQPTCSPPAYVEIDLMNDAQETPVVHQEPTCSPPAYVEIDMMNNAQVTPVVHQEPTCSPPAYVEIDMMNNAQVTPVVHQEPTCSPPAYVEIDMMNNAQVTPVVHQEPTSSPPAYVQIDMIDTEEVPSNTDNCCKRFFKWIRDAFFNCFNCGETAPPAPLSNGMYIV